MSKKKNKLVLIGFVGDHSAYLNVSEEDAIKRYCKDRDFSEKDYEGYNDFMDKEEFEAITGYSVETIEFDDEFHVYDAWEKE